MQTQQLIRHTAINREIINSIADSLAEEMARKMYHKLLMLKYLPEIKAVEAGELKAVRGKEIEKFFSGLQTI